MSLGITLVCVLISGFASTQVYYNSTIDDSKRFLRVYMNEFDESYSLDRQGAEAFSQKLNGARVTFMDGRGTVIADSLADDTGSSHSDRSEIKDAILNGEGFAVRGSSTLGKNMIYYCKDFDGRFLVRIAEFTDSDWSIFASTLPTLATFSVIMLALSLAAAFIATHFIISPVKQLARDALSDTDVKSKYSELAPIADMLNARNRDIRAQMGEITREKELAEQAKESKDEFISNITHEMNTPLTSIRGYAELLNAGGMNEKKKKNAYATIMAQSDRLTNLIACIINYSEIDSENLPSYEVDFSTLARHTLEALRPEAEKHGVTLNVEIADGVKISSRHELLTELLGNLTRNAIRYNKQGGSVTVSLDGKSLAVADTGIGIAEENLDKIFDRFFTVDKSHDGKNGGFGLGLAVVKKICRKSGWKLSVESKKGEGSKFTIEF